MKFEQLMEARKLPTKITKLPPDPISQSGDRYGFKSSGPIGAVGDYNVSTTSLGELTRNLSDDEMVLYLADLWVDDARRGEGLGTKLLRHFKNMAKRKNRKAVLITDRGSKSYPLYVREEFKDIGTSKYGGDSRVLVWNPTPN